MEIADVSSVQCVKHMTVQGGQVSAVSWVGNSHYTRCLAGQWYHDQYVA